MACWLPNETSEERAKPTISWPPNRGRWRCRRRKNAGHVWGVPHILYIHIYIYIYLYIIYIYVGYSIQYSIQCLWWRLASTVVTVTDIVMVFHNVTWLYGLGFTEYCWYTSSAAQGGGGSFKNRKPIRRVGCCDSRMAERVHWWTERWLELCFFWSGCNGCSGHLTHNCWMKCGVVWPNVLVAAVAVLAVIVL